MRTIKTVRYQSVWDLAKQLYANIDAAFELIRINDFTGQMDVPATVAADEIDLAYSLKPNVTVYYDETSALVDNKKLAELHGIDEDDPDVRASKIYNRNGVIIATGFVANEVFTDEFSDEFA